MASMNYFLSQWKIWALSVLHPGNIATKQILVPGSSFWISFFFFFTIFLVTGFFKGVFNVGSNIKGNIFFKVQKLNIINHI